MSDPYQILGLARNATDEQIKSAYRNLCKKYHPDTGKGDEKKMQEINQAYSVLSDPEKRRRHDNPLFTSPFMDINEILRNMGGWSDPFSGINSFSVQTFTDEISLSLTELLEGKEITYKKQGLTHRFKIPALTQPGTTLQVQLSSNQNKSVILNLYIKLKLPEKLTEEQIKKLKEWGI